MKETTQQEHSKATVVMVCRQKNWFSKPMYFPYCGKCNHRINDAGDIYCGTCGSELIWKENTMPITPEPLKNSTTEEEEW